MDNRNQNTNVDETARAVLLANRPRGQGKQLMLWIAALVVGGVLGCMGVAQLNELFSFIAAVFTRFFQFIAVPTIALAVITTLSELGAELGVGRSGVNHRLRRLMELAAEYESRRASG